jgi:AmmeMemoRadiSam system protein A
LNQNLPDSGIPLRFIPKAGRSNTAQAGFADPRFPPLSESDLAGLRPDVSILSHPRPVPAESESMLAGALEPDRDGLVLGLGRRRALFLPSVWRQLPDPRAFVRHLVAKAGLETTGWPAGLEAKRFRVESFGAPWRSVEAGEIAQAGSEDARSGDAPRLH